MITQQKQKVDKIYACEKCYKTVLNYAKFKENALLNYERISENVRKKRCAVSTPGTDSTKKVLKHQKLSVAEQIIKLVSKLHISPQSNLQKSVERRKSNLLHADSNNSKETIYFDLCSEE